MNNGSEAIIAGIVGLIALLLIAGILTALVFFYISMYKCLKRCEHHATMTPGYVFFNFIPFFNIVWVWITLFKVTGSVKSATNDEHNAGFGVGLALLIVSIVGGIFPPIGAIAILVLWIIYWIQVVAGGRAAEQALLEEDDYYDDDDDDDF